MANTLVQSPTTTAIINGPSVALAFASGGVSPVSSRYVASVTIEGTNTITSVADDRNGTYALDVSVSSGAVGAGK